MKTCINCKKEYPATAEYFYRRQVSKDGLNNRCVKCAREYAKNYSKLVEERKRKEAAERDKKIDNSYKLGKSYQVEYMLTERQKGIFRGKCGFVNKHYIMLENERGIRECFLIPDFNIDKKIKELG